MADRLGPNGSSQASESRATLCALRATDARSRLRALRISGPPSRPAPSGRSLEADSGRLRSSSPAGLPLEAALVFINWPARRPVAGSDNAQTEYSAPGAQVQAILTWRPVCALRRGGGECGC